ncbi:DUF2892 domain-containing protein [bacterium]|nr:DUF2892 domain-containing protein [bacterium]
MSCNVGGVDRIIRIVIGLGMIAFAVITRQWWGLIGVVPLLTAAIGWCPLYLPFKLSTCKTN